MRICKPLFTALCFSLFFSLLRAQDKLPVKFGKLTPEDFNVTVTGPDSAAGAVVIADYGTSSFEGSPRGWFDLVFKHSCRMKILKQSAFEAATIKIPLYVSGSESEKLVGLHAATYTLENGKVVETKVDEKAIFTDQLDRHWVEKKFTFPALKEGAIIEYTYTQSSPFLFNLQPWSFQGEYPCLWSEYEVDMPNFFRYVTLGHGYANYDINTTDSRTVQFHLTFPGGAEADDHESIEDEVVTHRWVMKNVPALKEEPFTTSIRNYEASLEFQLASYNFTQLHYYKDIMGNWSSVSEGLLEEADFGADLDKSNGWMDEELKPVLQGANGDREKAQRIFAFVRDKFNCTAHSSLYLNDPLKTVFKNKHGNEAELNLLLVALLRHEKIVADPVILSTRSHGFANEVYPLLSRFNYVICRAAVDSSRYYLDASEPWLGFGRLPECCYNGYARVLSKEMPSYVSLDADSMTEAKNTLVFISRPDKGSGLIGHLQSIPGFNESCILREEMKTKSQDDYFKTIKSDYTPEFAISNLELDSLNRPDDPLQVEYDLDIHPDSSADLFYFNPMLNEGIKENPFKSAERKYPVEMPFVMDDIYTLNMDIPDGYTVDELPKPAKVIFNENEGLYEYLIVKNGDAIQFRSRIKFSKANFKPEDYATLRDFFSYIVKKQSEQIVFKKKKTV
ncbi:MAG TPA: DUF3857 domain-containing protein [Puia sp.]|nr:DUF3857 domain-containing protein [Puia sp.]